MVNKIIELFRIFLRLFPFSDPWLFFAIISLIVWIVARYFPNFVLNIIRKGCVLIFGIVTIFAWNRCVYKIVFFLEYSLNVDTLLLLFFRQASDASIHGMVIGIIFFVWMAIAIFLPLYEIFNWKYVSNKKNEKKN